MSFPYCVIAAFFYEQMSESVRKYFRFSADSKNKKQIKRFYFSIFSTQFSCVILKMLSPNRFDEGSTAERK